MPGTSVVIVALSAMMILQACASSQKEPPKPHMEKANVTTLTATVEQIDYTNRTATLKREDGSVDTITAGDEVRNFNQVHVGDIVVAEYVDSVTVFVQKPEFGARTSQSSSMDRAKPGDMPSGIAVTTQEIRKTVLAIEYENRRVTLKGPSGDVETLNVDDRVENFRNVNVGDEVVVRHTKAIAIAVRKPEPVK